jgi:hypothetical protein
VTAGDDGPPAGLCSLMGRERSVERSSTVPFKLGQEPSPLVGNVREDQRIAPKRDLSFHCSCSSCSFRHQYRHCPYHETRSTCSCILEPFFFTRLRQLFMSHLLHHVIIIVELKQPTLFPACTESCRSLADKLYQKWDRPLRRPDPDQTLQIARTRRHSY